MTDEEIRYEAECLGISVEQYLKKEASIAAGWGITVEELRRRKSLRKNNRFVSHIGEFTITDPKTGKVLIGAKKPENN